MGMTTTPLTRAPGPQRSPAANTDDQELAARRHALVRDRLAREITDERVLDAMEVVPRHRFVSPDRRSVAYEDRPLSIGHDVTISQPYVVALMTQLADVQPGERVLEVGTGSGYQAAVLAQLGAEVFGIERIEALATRASTALHELGYERVHVRHGDGHLGWPSAAPFDAVLVTAAAPDVPQALLDQLALGGRLVAPIGPSMDDDPTGSGAGQELVVIEKTAGGLTRRVAGYVAFVPLLQGTVEGMTHDSDACVGPHATDDAPK